MNFKYEKAKLKLGHSIIVGCDEVGRGCLAGPVVAGAVALPLVESIKLKVIKSCGIKDSKLLTASKREELSKIIKAHCLWSIAEVSPKKIDKINILNASLLAMKKAVEELSLRVHPKQSLKKADCFVDQSKPWSPRNDSIFIFVDGKFSIPNLSIDQQAVIGGDNKVLSIAAASIIAKVYRDNLMKEFDKQYPEYFLDKHKGYATEIHRKAIIKVGLSPIHRKSFCSQYL